MKASLHSGLGTGALKHNVDAGSLPRLGLEPGGVGLGRRRGVGGKRGTLHEAPGKVELLAVDVGDKDWPSAKGVRRGRGEEANSAGTLDEHAAPGGQGGEAGAVDDDAQGLDEDGLLEAQEGRDLVDELLRQAVEAGQGAVLRRVGGKLDAGAQVVSAVQAQLALVAWEPGLDDDVVAGLDASDGCAHSINDSGGFVAHDQRPVFRHGAYHAAVRPEAHLASVSTYVHTLSRRWWMPGLTYVGSADAHVGDADDYIVGILDDGQRALLEADFARPVQDTGQVFLSRGQQGRQEDGETGDARTGRGIGEGGEGGRWSLRSRLGSRSASSVCQLVCVESAPPRVAGLKEGQHLNVGRQVGLRWMYSVHVPRTPYRPSTRIARPHGAVMRPALPQSERDQSVSENGNNPGPLIR